ncbi:MAG TPA: hypothetical protein PLP21_19635 [Pyrinomonadaceae bacterium]|nr:hypothetical protein [Pyrinomonadaceae bacterium]
MRAMKVIAIFLFVVSGVMTVRAQNTAQQTMFGSEVEITRPVTVSPSVLRKTGRDVRNEMIKCQKDKYRRATTLSDHFLGSLLNVHTSTGEKELLILQGNSGCFWGAHNTRILILAKKSGTADSTYKKIFEVQTDWLEVSTRSRRPLPDLTVFSHTAVELYVTTLRYSSGSYREVKCDVQMMGDDSPKPRTISCKNYNWEFREKEASPGN